MVSGLGDHPFQSTWFQPYQPQVGAGGQSLKTYKLLAAHDTDAAEELAWTDFFFTAPVAAGPAPKGLAALGVGT